ncbi:hypothetical protein ACFY0A_34750 [Streptomyces sp. NPDC001698]|uniref:hypothetical protein n=1 Tax=Streptomyces sp. NPDC001698 TaxID=3364601 RepID=UPI0036C7CB62
MRTARAKGSAGPPRRCTDEERAAVPAPAGKLDSDPDLRIAGFRTAASENSFALAVLSAAAPLNRHVMQLIAVELLPEADSGGAGPADHPVRRLPEPPRRRPRPGGPTPPRAGRGSSGRLRGIFDDSAHSRSFEATLARHPAAVASGLALGAAAVAATRGRRAREYLVRRSA